MSDYVEARERAVEVKWRRIPIAKDVLRSLTRRSDFLGFLQAGGFLALLALTALAAFSAWRNHPVWTLVIVLFVHGTFYAFLLNGFHELVHRTVFRTRALNTIFLYIYSFLSWNSHVYFHASHVRHHLSTLHPEGDKEVVLPIKLHVRNLLMSGIVDFLGFFYVVRDLIRLSLRRYRGEWELIIFPEDDPAARRRLSRWARVLLLGHTAIIAVSIATGLWMVAVVTSFARFYGGWLQWLCNNTQHVGLQDNVDDFRLCCRTIHLNPFVRFLYFHMNYHTEHHMYAAVPCYNLGKLHRAIRAGMPPVARGLVPAWREIISILKIQEKDPTYQHVQVFPETAAT